MTNDLARQLDEDRRSMLDEAYRNTTFRVLSGTHPIDLRIGALSPELDTLLRSQGATAWAFITAWNPYSEALRRDENDTRQRALEQLFSSRGLHTVPGLGVPADDRWTPEESLIVLGLSRGEAIALGAQFGQHAIVWGELGRAAELCWC